MNRFRERVIFSYPRVWFARGAILGGVALCVAPALVQRFESEVLVATIPAGLILLFGGLLFLKRDTRIAAVHFDDRGFWFYRVNGVMTTFAPQKIAAMRLEPASGETENLVLYLRGETGVVLRLRQRHARRDLRELYANLKVAYNL